MKWLSLVLAVAFGASCGGYKPPRGLDGEEEEVDEREQAATADEDALAYYREVRAAHDKRDAPAYDRLLQAGLNEARHLKDHLLIRRQQQVTQVIRERGADGLESLVLFYADLLAQSTDPAIASQREAGLVALKSALWFAREAPPHMYIRTAKAHTFAETTVRGEALRILVRELVRLDAKSAAKLGRAGLLNQPQTQSLLCNAPVARNQCGQIVPQDLIRLEACRRFGVPGGPTVIQQMCDGIPSGRGSIAATPTALFPPRWNAQPKTGPTLANGSVTPPGGCGAGTLDAALRDLCQSLRGQSGGSAGGALPGVDDPLDTLSETACFGGSLAERAAGADVGALVTECMEASIKPGGNGNPLTIFIGIVIVIKETLDAMIQHEKFIRENPACWPNCQKSNKSELPDSPKLDLTNPACAELARLAANGGRTLYDTIKQPGSAPNIGPKVNPHPDSDPGLADPVACVDATAVSGASRCNEAMHCAGATTLDPATCTCQRAINNATLEALLYQNPRCIQVDCGPDRMPVGPTCSCAEPLAPREPLPPRPPAPF